MKRTPIARKTPMRSRREGPTAPREPKPLMDAAVKAIHGNEAFSLENVGRSVSQALARRVTYGGALTGATAQKREKAAGGKAEHEHKERLAALGCMACRRIHGPHEPGPVELHHLRKDGWGKGDYRTLMPLCVEHHRGPTGVHGLGTRGFAAHYGFDQQDLLDDALKLLEVMA